MRELAAGTGSARRIDTRSADPALIYFTSGTVGNPKMVLHTQASYGIGHVVTARYWQDLKPGDLHWTVSDTGWAKAAWGKLFGQWTLGASVVQMDMGRPDAEHRAHRGRRSDLFHHREIPSERRQQERNS